MYARKLQLSGLSCGSCVGRAEQALSGVEGVLQATVNLADETARVEFDAPADLARITQALDRAGYPAQTTTETFLVPDMHCGSCVGRVENALNGHPDVIAARANLADETVRVTYLAGAAPRTELLAAATRAGYPLHSRPDATTTNDEKRSEAETLRRDLIIAGALTLPVFVVEMGGHLIPAVHSFIHQTIGMQMSWVLQFILVTLVMAIPGRRIITRGFATLARGAPDMNALVALGTSAAWGFSCVATFLPAVLPAGTRAVYFEAAAVIITLIILGRYLEAQAKGKTGAAIGRLIALQPQTATRIVEGQAETVAIDHLAPGDVIRAFPGARIAADGIVITGQSFVDESMISGEAMPVSKAADDPVTGGTLNGAGTLDISLSHVGADTVLARIVDMVSAAQAARLPIHDLVNRVTLWFVPVVMGVALATIAVWLVFGPDPALGLALVAGVSVLIVACPCAMGLATPTSIMVGTGRAAELGVLFRKGDALQSLSGVRTVAFDKTGTLTEGHPRLTQFEALAAFDRDTVLTLLASLEAQSEHPIASAILAAHDGPLTPATEVEVLPGFGMTGRVGEHRIIIGTQRLMEAQSVDAKAASAIADQMAETGQTPLCAAIDGHMAAVIGVSDPLKPGARSAVEGLLRDGLRVVMISGDTTRTAKAIAASLGISEVHAQVLPDQKAKVVAQLKSTAGPVAFVGDGINDAPALATADVGIAMGTGTDIAIESADVVLMSGDPVGVLRALQVSRATMRNIRQNLFWAFGYNTALIPVAAGALYVFGGPLLSPMLAAGAMALSSVFVVTNALRLRTVGSKTGTDADAADSDMAVGAT